MKIITFFKRSNASTASLRAPDPVPGHCWPMPLSETPGHSRASLGQSLVGSVLLSPGSRCTQGSVYALPESVFPVLCKFWWLHGGVNATSSKRAYAIPRSAAPRALTPAAGHCWHIPPQEMLKHSGRSGSLSVESPGVHKVLFEPSEHLWWLWGLILTEHLWQVWGLILNVIFPLLPSCWDFSFAFGCGVYFFCGIQHSSVDSCSAVSCYFGVLTGDEYMFFLAHCLICAKCPIDKFINNFIVIIGAHKY